MIKDNSQTKKEFIPKMVFVYAQFNDIIKGYVEAFTYSLSTTYIRAYLAEKNIYTEQYIQNQPGTVRQSAEEILSLGSDIIGFSCVDTTLYFSLLVADYIKKIKPETTIIFGGVTATLSDEFIMRQNPSIDICCIGEGEETCYELILKLINKEELNDVKGITYRSKGQLIRTPSRPIGQVGEKHSTLDFLPSPYLSGVIDFNKIRNDDFFQYSIITARGCTHKCTYCTNTAMGQFRVRYHSVERVIDEIKWMKQERLPGSNIYFYDDAFTINVKRAKDICRRIIEESLNDIGYECITRIDKFDEELLQLMVQAGFKTVAFGLESASPKILNTIKKVRSNPAVNGDYGPELSFLDIMKKNISKANSMGMSTGVSFIFGLPGETKEEAQGTLDFVRDLKVDTCFHNYLDICRGTEIFDTCQQFGINMRPSPFILPPLTEFAYNVFQLEPLKNTMNIDLLNHWNIVGMKMIQSIFGIWKMELPDQKKEGIHVFIENLPENESELFIWLSSIVQYNSTLFIVEDHWKPHSFENRLTSFAKAKMPLNVYRRMKKEVKYSQEKNISNMVSFGLKYFDRIRIPYPECTDEGEPGMSFHIMPLSFKDEKNINPNTEIKIKSIESKDDLSHLLNLYKPLNEIVLSLEQIETNDYAYDILNKCRWSNHLCDACSMDRMIIGEGNNIYSCYGSTPIGKVGDTYSDLKYNIEEIRRKTLKYRGCDSCVVKESCAKCLFLPTFLTDEDYCKAMKGDRKIAVAVEIPSLVMQLKAQMEDQLENAQEIKISWLTRPAMEKILESRSCRSTFSVCIGYNTYLFDTERKIFSPLSKTMGKILNHLACGEFNRGKLCQTLADEHNLSLKAIVNAFDMLILKIRELSE